MSFKPSRLIQEQTYSFPKNLKLLTAFGANSKIVQWVVAWEEEEEEWELTVVDSACNSSNGLL